VTTCDVRVSSKHIAWKIETLYTLCSIETAISAMPLLLLTMNSYTTTNFIPGLGMRFGGETWVGFAAACFLHEHL